VTGKPLGSDLDSFRLLSYNLLISCCFIKIEGNDRERIGQAIVVQSEKPRGLRREAGRHAQSRSSGELQGLVVKDAAGEKTY
jgi:hypothetical protein